MMICKWEELPPEMQTEEVRPYWELLQHRKAELICKRAFDVTASAAMLFLLSPVFLALAVAIKADSDGPVFYRQERITQYGERFRIHKFRSMVQDADRKGTLVTVSNDARITKVGKFIRDKRLDEIAQLLDVLAGDMTFVGTRPEVEKYVKEYTPEMMATLLLPAGITSTASINYKDENRLLDAADDVDRVYIEKVLPDKMKWNLDDVKKFGIFRELQIMFKTVFTVWG